MLIFWFLVSWLRCVSDINDLAVQAQGISISISLFQLYECFSYIFIHARAHAANHTYTNEEQVIPNCVWKKNIWLKMQFGNIRVMISFIVFGMSFFFFQFVKHDDFVLFSVFYSYYTNDSMYILLSKCMHTEKKSSAQVKWVDLLIKTYGFIWMKFYSQPFILLAYSIDQNTQISAIFHLAIISTTASIKIHIFS